MRPLIYVADAHLTGDDPEVDVFIAFLKGTGSRASAIGILGDLFNLWFGNRKFRLPHHTRIIEALEDLKSRGVRLFYVEGNRDFNLRRSHLGRPFDAIESDHHVETIGGWRVWATHGDAINADDRQYRAWKAFSKSAPVYGAFSLMPGSWGMSLAERLERKLSGTNIRNKSSFPEDHCRRYGRRVLDAGCHALVLGHFHEERTIPLGERDGRPVAAWILPAFRHTHRYLVFDGEGAPRFEGFPG
jgi:UDP-2,3-diacylglucosamine hydrolase